MRCFADLKIRLMKWRLPGAAAFFLAFSAPAFAAIPQTINYQGFLVSKLTNTAVDSPQDMKFLIYDVESGGSPLFTEYRCNVSISRGRYDVEIGSSTAGGIPASIFQGQAQGLWLEIQVDADGDCAGSYEAMQPRVRLQASPFSFNSLYASTASAGPVYSPSGTPPFNVDIIGAHEQTTNGAVTISSNLYVTGGIAVGSISPGMKLSVGGKVESKGDWPDCAPEGADPADYTCGFVFPDGSVQTVASGETMWRPANGGIDLFNTNIGNVGISTTSPQAKLHISSGAGETGDVFRIDADTTPVFRVTGQGKVYGSYFAGDGSGLYPVNDTSRVSKYARSERMYGSLTISSPVWSGAGGGAVSGSSLTLTDARGIIARRLEFGANVSLSSVTYSAVCGNPDPRQCSGYWAGIYVSTHIFVSTSAKIIGDGSMITGVISEDNTKVLKAGDMMSGHLMLNGSSMTIITSNTVDASYSLAITTDPAQQGWHLYLSTAGNLGIGTADPTQKLQVQGAILAASSVTAQTGFYTQGPISANTITSVYGITASSGTFGSWGAAQYSIETTTGINVTHGEVYAPFFRGNGAALTNVSGTDVTKVAKAGDTMSGPLRLNGALTVAYSSVTIISSNGASGYNLLVSTVADPNYYTLVVTTRGYVGVRLPNPAANLDVYRNLQISNSQAGDYANLNMQTFAGYNYIRWADNSLSATVNQGVLGFMPASRNFVYRAAALDPEHYGAEVFRIRSDFEGNWAFGIGTTDPKTQLHVNADMLVGQDLSVPTLLVSTGTASISVATTTVSHKLVVNGGIMAVSSITAGNGLYGTFYGDLYTSSITVGNTKGEDAATMKIGERYGNDFTLVVGTNNTGSYYDMVLMPDGQMGLGVNTPQARFHTIKNIRIGSWNETAADGASLSLDPMGGDTYIRWGEFGSTNKGSLGFIGNSRDLLYKRNSGNIGEGDELLRIMDSGGAVFRSSLTVAGTYGMTATADVLNVAGGMLVVTKDGRAGVGVAAPTYNLDVNGAALIRSSAAISGTGLSGTQTVFQVAGSTLFVRMDGRVGVGTNNPQYKLDVSGGAIVRSSFVVSGTAFTGNQTVFSAVGSTLVVRADGIVGIGVADPAAITDRLEVNGTVKATGFKAGWERISTTCNTSASCTHSCSAGKKLMGGGCANTLSTSVLYSSYPSADDTWSCSASDALGDITVYVICSMVQP